MRPHQWVKNIFVLAAILFAGGEGFTIDQTSVIATLFAIAAFCLGSSTIYLVNDIMDVESDRKHPEKCKRPIAAGELEISSAWMVSAACFAGAVACALAAGGQPIGVIWIVLAYVTLNFFYSVKLKHIVLVDAFCIAAGFLFRVEGGALAIGVPVSHWLFLCTLFLSLFLALCKRKAETDLLGENAAEHRRILREYNADFLNQMITLLASCTIISYTMYTVSDATKFKFGADHILVWTVPFVVFGLGRYLLLVQTQKGGGSPTKILLGGDLTFFLTGLGWLAVVVYSLYKPFS
ncbi:MAG: 4-hydroxybenzoate polyprenyltransferase [Planctomycetota bacterium]|jgi:4-hydroxybenzoate polyprenyltransferase